VTSWQTSVARLAPERGADDNFAAAYASARARNNPATFTHAINSTSATAPSKHQQRRSDVPAT
jgi:hypothetical protein